MIKKIETDRSQMDIVQLVRLPTKIGESMGSTPLESIVTNV